MANVEELNWLQMAVDATSKQAATLYDTQALDTANVAFAAGIQAQIGRDTMLYYIPSTVKYKGDKSFGPGWFKMDELLSYVTQADKDYVAAVQAAYSDAQQQYNQRNTIAGGFVSTENNKATSADTTNIQQLNQCFSALNQFTQQMGSLQLQ